jgi:hypothetical protein
MKTLKSIKGESVENLSNTTNKSILNFRETIPSKWNISGDTVHLIIGFTWIYFLHVINDIFTNLTKDFITQRYIVNKNIFVLVVVWKRSWKLNVKKIQLHDGKSHEYSPLQFKNIFVIKFGDFEIYPT